MDRMCRCPQRVPGGQSHDAIKSGLGWDDITNDRQRPAHPNQSTYNRYCDKHKHDDLDIDHADHHQQAAATLPALYVQRAEAELVKVLTLERPDILESFQDIFIPAVLIVAMFMGCTFNGAGMGRYYK